MSASAVAVNRLLPLLVACLAMAACGGGGGDGGGNAFAAPAVPAASACGVAAEKSFVQRATSEWYLFLELLPVSVDPAAFASADDLLDALTATARAQGRDRFFSYITTISEEQQFFAEGRSVGFGFSTTVPGGTRQLFVTQVFDGSAAADAGFLRGDEILAIGADAAGLQSVTALLAQPDALSQALGPSQTGITRLFRMRTPAGQMVDRTVSKREFSLDPVPETRLIERPGLSPIGYVNLRTFIGPADPLLREAFAGFAARGVQEVILDLRYNGGGAVATATLLADLLLAGQAGQVLVHTRLNRNKAANEETVNVQAEAQAIPAQRIAVLALGATASASELVISALAPYAEVAIVGARTYGKPVGQYAFDLSTSCDMRLRLVTFRTTNRDDYGDYYGGLPDTSAQVPDAFCEVADDLTRAQGDSAEALTGTAIRWLDEGVCPARVAAEARAALAPEESFPRIAHRPAPFQVAQPGAF